MKNVLATIAGLAVMGLALTASAVAQEAGDYRSAADGDWSAAATWEVFDGADWAAAADAPEGSEMITIGGEHTVTVDGAVSITGTVQVTETATLTVGETGTLEFADGSTYEHARDAGDVPEAGWGDGSTFLLTGTVQDAPGNRSQDFYNIVINTPDLGRNRDLSLNEVTIGGDVHVISTGANRWQLTSASGGEAAEFTIMGDVIVDDGQFAVQGTGNALTTFTVHHHGDLIVNGGNFSPARGSQGSGSGTTTWYLYGGDLIMSNATTQNSNSTPGNAKYVFAGNETQLLSLENMEYGGGTFDLEVADSTTLEIADGVELPRGQLVNQGEVEALGALTFGDEAIYEHARDGGDVPSATWAEGSTALFTGMTGSAPGNRGQDYYNLTLDTPDMLSNLDLSLADHTISGDLRVLNSGSARWRLIGGDSGEITIMGDVIIRDAALETQGTGSETHVVIHHYGDVDVDGGNFSISRGSQSGGAGTTTWYLYEGDFSMANARTQNSNPTPGNAQFVFASGDTTQTLTLGEGNQLDNLSIEVADSTTLNIGMNVIEGSGVFTLQPGATVITTHPDGLSANLQMDGEITLLGGGITYGGTEAQSLGMLPDSLSTLTIANAEGVTASDTNYVEVLNVQEGTVLEVDSTGAITAGGGTIDGTIVNRGEIEAEEPLDFGATAVYEHARDAGDVPNGNWGEGSTFLLTGTVQDAPGNRNQSYYNITINTPELGRNRDLSLDDVTIGGDIHVITTGEPRWYLTSASATDSASVEILGDVLVEDGQFAVQGTGNALTTFEVHHYGDIVVTGGNFSIGRGSQGEGSGTTTWYLHEGDFTMSGATTQNSNPTPGNAKFVFDADGTQTLTLGEDNEISNLSIEVAEGTTLDVGTSEIGGSGYFMLNAGATLVTAHPDGVAGAVQSSGEVTLDEAANYTFNGSDAQMTSTSMPVTVNDLTIDNTAGVTLSQETTINGVLLLANGVFDNTIPFMLGEEGSIVEENGSLLIPVGIEELDGLPTEFALHQNYPNPFNPSTMIRYDVREGSEVSIAVYDVAGRMVRQLVHEHHAPGRYEVEWNAAGLSSGVYLYQIRAGDFTATRKLMLVK